MKHEKTLEDILKELSVVSGFRISVYDTKRREICAFPPSLTSFCHLVQSNPKAIALCRKYDNKAFQAASETGKAYIYRCHFGLYEAVAPLYHFGVLSGYLMMGQTLDTMKKNREDVYLNALPFIADQKKLEKAVKEIPHRSKKQIASCVSIMEICAEYITISSYLKAQVKDIPTMVMAYLNENYSKKITLDELCQKFYCSRGTLTSSFRKVYQCSILTYLNQIRLSNSINFLEKSDLSIHSISSLCGFSDQNYYTKVFQREYGYTPTEYRKMHS